MCGSADVLVFSRARTPVSGLPRRTTDRVPATDRGAPTSWYQGGHIKRDTLPVFGPTPLPPREPLFFTRAPLLTLAIPTPSPLDEDPEFPPTTDNTPLEPQSRRSYGRSLLEVMDKPPYADRAVTHVVDSGTFVGLSLGPSTPLVGLGPVSPTISGSGL